MGCKFGARFLITVSLIFWASFLSVGAAEVSDGGAVDFSVHLVKDGEFSADALANLKRQNELLEAQLKVMKEYHGSLLDTVYWALAGVLVLVSLLLGFGWFANFKIYERDKDALRKELKAHAETELAGLKSNVDEHAASAAESQDRAINEKVQDVRNKLFSECKALGARVFCLELRTLRERMEAEVNPSMALTKSIGVLELCVAGANEDIPAVLNFILKKMDEGGKFTAYEITRVQVVIDGLPAHYVSLVEKVRSRLVASDIF